MKTVVDSNKLEWDAAAATAYWPDQRGHWAPVSWKDHLYDFSVFYNGTVLANGTGIGLNPNSLPEDQIFAAELRVRFATDELIPASACDAATVDVNGTNADRSL